MADFEINKTGAIAAVEALNELSRRIAGIESETARVMSQLKFSITAMLADRLQRTYLCSNIDACRIDMTKLSQVLHKAVNVYFQSDNNVLRKDYSYRKTTKNSKTAKEWVNDLLDKFGKAVKKGVKKVVAKGKKFVKKVVDGGKWLADKVTKGYYAVKGAVVTTIDYIKDNYANHGWIYKTVQYGKATVKIVGGVAKVVAGVVAIAGSYGTSTPLSVAAILSGINETANGITDVVNISKENYDDVGNVNYMKTGLESAGGWIGGALGSEKVGKAIGSAEYYGIEIAALVGSFQNKTAEFKQVDSINFGKLGTEIKNLPEMTWKYLNSNASEWKLQWKLMTKEIPQTMTAVSKISKGYDVLSISSKIAKNVNTYYTETTGQETPFSGLLNGNPDSAIENIKIPFDLREKAQKVRDNMRVLSGIRKSFAQ